MADLLSLSFTAEPPLTGAAVDNLLGANYAADDLRPDAGAFFLSVFEFLSSAFL